MTLDPIIGDKLTPKYEGPYTVVSRNAGGAYVLRDGTGAILGRSQAPSQLKLVLDDEDESDTYEVEKIIAHRPHLLKKSKKEYLVKWKNYSARLNTWEPEENFVKQSAINDYWRDPDNISAQPNPCIVREDKILDDSEYESRKQKKQTKRKQTRAHGSNKRQKKINKHA